MANKIEIIVAGFDKFSGMFNNLNAGLDRMADRFRKSARASKLLAIGLAAVGAAVGVLGLSMLKAAGRFEQSQIAFTTMLGSAEKAKKLLKDLADFARRTPFELVGLEGLTKRLLAYGITQKDVLTDLETLGNISAGVGMDKMPQLILAFGQVSAKTRLMGQELRQFAEAGVPLLDALAKQLNVDVKEVQNMVSAGKVGFPIVRKALMDLTSEGGRFENLMAKQAKSLEGLWSNLIDAWGIFLRNEGKALLEWGKSFVRFLINLVDNVLPRFITLVKEVTGWLSAHKEVLVVVAGIIAGALTPAVIALATAFALLLVALAPFMLGGALIAGAIAGVMLLVKHWEKVSKPVREFGATLKEVLVDGASLVSAAMTTLFSDIRYGFEVLTDFVKEKTLAAALWIVNKLNVILPKAWKIDTTAMESNLDKLKKKVVEPAITFAEAFENSKESINGAFEFVGEKVDEAKEYVLGSISDMWDGILETFNSIFGEDESILTPDKILSEETAEVVKERWELLWEGLVEHVKESMITIQEITNEVWDSFQSGFGDAISRSIVYGEDFGKSMKKTFKSILANFISMIAQMIIQQIMFGEVSGAIALKDALRWIYATAGKLFMNIYNSIAAIPYVGPFLAPAMAVAGTAAAIGGAVNLVGSAHGGLEDVPREGTYLLDKGERVLKPNQNKDLENFMSGGGGGNINIEELNIMPGASITEELFEKSIEWWRDLTLERILPALNMLGEEGARTTLGHREGRI